jgi:uncharacterized protein (TIGR02594 family)
VVHMKRSRNPGPRKAAENPGSSSETLANSARRGKRIFRWVHITVDNRPWWLLILSAALGAIGSGVIGAVPSITTHLSQWLSGIKVFIQVKDETSGNPIDGVEISFRNIETWQPIRLSGGGENNTVTTKSGVAYAIIHATPGPGSMATFKLTLSGIIRTRPEIIEKLEAKTYSFVVNPNKWSIQGGALAATPVPLAASYVPADAPFWMKLASAELGTQESKEGADNPRIAEYFMTTALGSQPDSVQWNSAFVNWVISKAGLTGTNRAEARSWLTWGNHTDLRVGCIAVFWRGPDSKMGHVGFFIGQDEFGLSILGGNQHNSVNVSRFNKSNFLGCRWPS